MHVLHGLWRVIAGSINMRGSCSFQAGKKKCPKRADIMRRHLPPIPFTAKKVNGVEVGRLELN